MMEACSSHQTQKPVILIGGGGPQSKDPATADGGTTFRILLIQIIVGVALIFTGALHAQGQGCAQCLDTTRSTPPSVQAAYRHAILLLGGFAATLFIAGGVLLTRRQR